MYSCGDTTQGGGLPHSEIVGSKLIRSSPTLIAAYHVLHRLLMPRHSPYALIILNDIHTQITNNVAMCINNSSVDVLFYEYTVKN